MTDDYSTKKLNKTHARKKISEIVHKHPENVRFSRHALEELGKDNLTTVDAWNVLRSNESRIITEGELEKGTFRYRLETTFIMVVVAFQVNRNGLFVITVWDKRKKAKGVK